MLTYPRTIQEQVALHARFPSFDEETPLKRMGVSFDRAYTLDEIAGAVELISNEPAVDGVLLADTRVSRIVATGKYDGGPTDLTLTISGPSAGGLPYNRFVAHIPFLNLFSESHEHYTQLIIPELLAPSPTEELRDRKLEHVVNWTRYATLVAQHIAEYNQLE